MDYKAKVIKIYGNYMNLSITGTDNKESWNIKIYDISIPNSKEFKLYQDVDIEFNTTDSDSYDIVIEGIEHLQKGEVKVSFSNVGLEHRGSMIIHFGSHTNIWDVIKFDTTIGTKYQVKVIPSDN